MLVTTIDSGYLDLIGIADKILFDFIYLSFIPDHVDDLPESFLFCQMNIPDGKISGNGEYDSYLLKIQKRIYFYI